MYSALNEDFMYQEMHDRVARISSRRGKVTVDVRPNRRWWNKAARLAR